eukprot:CAMPEP_0203747310 /NCGR_PEP_ID=MMETSP0098-20131031/2489_1 /ASSEMBLY_ACC=CAM_ASM_000208 /TAXON_ID=96639 /ORGANISM=" , Strain NY0313808BC1" /LENGTH=44 /DNA_ID= /DNA_START= /DNA_END= /DNA_ORIENTATION=
MTTLQDSTTDDWKEEPFASIKALLPAGASAEGPGKETSFKFVAS